jgi:hypothetical protein
MTDMSREFVYPRVTEVLRAGGSAAPETAPGLPRWASQRELVEASLLRCPEKKLAGRPGALELSVIR